MGFEASQLKVGDVFSNEENFLILLDRMEEEDNKIILVWYNFTRLMTHTTYPTSTDIVTRYDIYRDGKLIYSPIK